MSKVTKTTKQCTEYNISKNIIEQRHQDIEHIKKIITNITNNFIKQFSVNDYTPSQSKDNLTKINEWIKYLQDENKFKKNQHVLYSYKKLNNSIHSHQNIIRFLNQKISNTTKSN